MNQVSSMRQPREPEDAREDWISSGSADADVCGRYPRSQETELPRHRVGPLVELDQEALRMELARVIQPLRDAADQTYRIVGAKTLFSELVSWIPEVEQVWSRFEQNVLESYILVAADDPKVRDSVYDAECRAMDAFADLDFDFHMMPADCWHARARAAQGFDLTYSKAR